MSNGRPSTICILLAPIVFSLANTEGAPDATIISKGGDPASRLVNTLFADGLAAGLDGVYYDNRDRKHSDLGIGTYPQLKPITYTEAELKARADWGGQHRLLAGKVVVGNSSTASPAKRAGSHQRMFYTHPQGLSFLYEQYRSNALYIYPEHRDHDPGTNGPDGYGDLYPANSPYLVASQGSSGSDRVFMHAFLLTVAAFPPETRDVLVAKGLLMPTLQAIFRQTYQTSRATAEPAGFFTGNAHPSAFDGKLINGLAMVKLAQAMAPDAIPPLVKLHVVAEPELIPGRDFFEPPHLDTRAETLADSPCAIARVVRGPAQTRTIHVSAGGSIDPRDRPLRFRWVVLRGDPQRVQILPPGERRHEATISVKYHPRRPVAPGSAMWSNRIDIGVFAKAEGSIASAPAFISFTTLPNEHRTYADDGRLLEIFYGARSQALGMPPVNSGRWDGLLGRFHGEHTEGLLKAVLAKTTIAALTSAAADTRGSRAALAAAEEKLSATTAAQQKVVDATNKIRVEAVADHKKLNTGASKAALDRANAKHDLAKRVMRDGADGTAELKAEIADLRQKITATLRAKTVPEIIRNELQRLIENPGLPVAAADHPKALAALKLLESIGVHASEDPSPNDRYHLEQANREILAGVLFPNFLKPPQGPLYADPRLTTTKNWRDVYRYAADGSPAGWTRYQNAKKFEFTAKGELIRSRKPDGSPDGVVEVRYAINPTSKRLEWSGVE